MRDSRGEVQLRVGLKLGRCCSDVGGSVATAAPEEEGSGRVSTIAHRGLWHPPCSGSERHHGELISTSTAQRGRVPGGAKRQRPWLFATDTVDEGCLY
jgi:hypothetical protein